MLSKTEASLCEAAASARLLSTGSVIDGGVDGVLLLESAPAFDVDLDCRNCLIFLSMINPLPITGTNIGLVSV